MNYNRFILENVMIQFVNVFTPSAKDPNKYSVKVKLHKEKDKKAIDIIKAHIEKIQEDNGKCTKTNIFFIDGDGSEYYDGCYYFSASRPVSDTFGRPNIVDRQKNPILPEDNKIGMNDIVNIDLSLWYQNNKHGQRVNCRLNGIQVVEHKGIIKDEVDLFKVVEDDNDLIANM